MRWISPGWSVALCLTVSSLCVAGEPSRFDVADYLRTLYQARGQTPEHRNVMRSSVELADEYRDLADHETNMDVRGPHEDANDIYSRLGVLRYSRMGAPMVFDPAFPLVGGRWVTPSMVRSLGGRYAPASSGVMYSGLGLGGLNLSRGSEPIGAGAYTFQIVPASVPADTVRMTPEQRRRFGRTNDPAVLAPQVQQVVADKLNQKDMLREVNMRRAAGEDVTYYQVAAERRAAARAEAERRDELALMQAQRELVERQRQASIAHVEAQTRLADSQAESIQRQNLALAQQGAVPVPGAMFDQRDPRVGDLARLGTPTIDGRRAAPPAGAQQSAAQQANAACPYCVNGSPHAGHPAVLQPAAAAMPQMASSGVTVIALDDLLRARQALGAGAAPSAPGNRAVAADAALVGALGALLLVSALIVAGAAFRANAGHSAG